MWYGSSFVNYSHKRTSDLMAFGLALLAGLGMVLMMVAGGIGAVQGDKADSRLIGIVFALGLVSLVSGIIAWIAVVQPHRHFDDIDVPLEAEGHGHDEHADDDHAAIVAVNDDHAHPVTTAH